ncbi:hypothetical protein PR048_010673 [Dryococelus australis]|uniref:Uncharacterized protein n=1 Tax=Dryococelus australis TaxID=614101 RepID=A0ABQ9I5C2_9NEOP|nr:hypothetical protein PR048_010673 [Dryococelus australis]
MLPSRVASPGGSLPDFRKWESCRVMPLVAGFLGVLPFPRICIPALLHSHLISPSSALNTSLRAVQISQLNLRRRQGFYTSFAHVTTPFANQRLVTDSLAASTANTEIFAACGSQSANQRMVVPDDAAGRWVFSGISSFLSPFIPALLHTYLGSPSSAIKTSILARKHLANPITARCGATANEHAAEPPVCRGLRSLAYRSLNSRNFPIPNNYGHWDKIDVKHVYTEVDLAIGSQFITHALDDSEAIAYLQGNKYRVPYCQARLYSLMQKYADLNCTLVFCCRSRRRQLDTVLQEVSNSIGDLGLEPTSHHVMTSPNRHVVPRRKRLITSFDVSPFLQFTDDSRYRNKAR